MRRWPAGAELLLKSLTPRRRAFGDWQTWVGLPKRLTASLKAIDGADSVTVGYMCGHRIRPVARAAPCQLLRAAPLSAAKLFRLQALERSYGRRYVLVAYRLPRNSSNNSR
jgi:hypothetical protein